MTEPKPKSPSLKEQGYQFEVKGQPVLARGETSDDGKVSLTLLTDKGEQIQVVDQKDIVPTS